MLNKFITIKQVDTEKRLYVIIIKNIDRNKLTISILNNFCV